MAKNVAREKTVTEALSIARIPADVREICTGGEINAKSSLLQIVRQPDDDSMRRLAKQIASQGLNRNDAREARRQDMGPRVVPDSKPFIYKYSDRTSNSPWSPFSSSKFGSRDRGRVAAVC